MDGFAGGKLDCNKIQKYDPQGDVNLSWKCSRPFKISPPDKRDIDAGAGIEDRVLSFISLVNTRVK